MPMGYSAEAHQTFTGGSNHSINQLGNTGGTATDLARIIAAAQGPDANGGFSSVLGIQDTGGLFRSNTMPLLLVGVVALVLVGVVIWKA